MRQPFRRFLVPALVAGCALPAAAQGYSPEAQANGWAHQDRDFTFTFFDTASRTLNTWDKAFGITGTLSLAKLDGAPEMWLFDRYGSAWVVSGTTLYLFTKDGKLDSRVKLPAPVGDMAWDGQTGFVLAYRTASTYLEMRDYKGGGVLWSYGDKPKKDDTPGRSLTRVAVAAAPGGEPQVMVSESGSLSLTVLSLKGSLVGHTNLSLFGQPPPALDLGKEEPMALCTWFGKGVIFMGVDSEQLPKATAGQLAGLLLARMDLGDATIRLLPTGLTPDHRFIGVVDNSAVFVKPGGGLAYVPVK